MNREIKFRLYSESMEQMFYSSPFEGDQPKREYVPFEFCIGFSHYDIDSFSPLMQFTGLKDKNGKDIYEGDILQFKYYYVSIRWWSSVSEIAKIKEDTENKRREFHLDKEVVRFRDGSFCKGYEQLSNFQINNGIITERLKTGTGITCDFEEKWWDFEIIGNIYETPDLLK